MKILHVSSSISHLAGGIFEIERELCLQLASKGHDVAVAGLKDQAWNCDKEKWLPLMPQACAVVGPKFWGYSPGLRENIENSGADIGHLHTMWMYPSIALNSWGRRKKKPYMVTPNGMLDPWALRNSGWKKRLALRCYEMSCLSQAACIHVNTQKERDDVRDLFRPKATCLIPNGVSLHDFSCVTHEKRDVHYAGKKLLLFLGRIHPKKGITNAIDAWFNLQTSMKRAADCGWQLAIAGWDQLGHQSQLVSRCRESGMSVNIRSGSESLSDFLKNSRNCDIVFIGPAFSDEKRVLYRQADAFILPSFSEGLPMAVLEAWSYRLPVIMTDFCNLPEGFAADAALRIEPNAASIRSGIESLIQMSDQQRFTMGLAGRRLVESKFAWPSVAQQMAQVYRWVLGQGDQPAFVDVY